MTRLSHALGLLPAVALAVGTLAFTTPAALADQYPRNWNVQSTDVPQPVYDFLPGHNARMRVPGVSAQNSTPTAGPIEYQFTPGSTTFHHVAN